MLAPEFFMLSAYARSSYALAFVLASRHEESEALLRADELQAFTAIPIAKQELALKELARHGMIALEPDGFRLPMFDEMQRPRSSAERMKALRDRDDWGDDSVTETGGVGDGKSDDSVTKRNRRTEYTPGKANALPPPGVVAETSRVRIEPVRLDATFGEVERLVVSVLANDAAERKDGKIASTVVDALRQKLARHREKYGLDAVRHGLEIALDKGHGIDYACGCAKKFKPGEEFSPSYAAPEREYAQLSVPEHLRRYDEAPQ